jgi:hypothetical protein
MKRLTRPRALAAGLLGAILAASAGSALGGPLLMDDYGVGAPDVLGNGADFDIRSLEIQELSPTLLRIELRLNYHGGDTTLAAFSESGTSFASSPVGAGDVLIQGKSSLWAIPLSGATGGPGGIYSAYGVGDPVPVGTPATRIGFLPGSIYRVTQTVDAATALGVDPADDFRANVIVWGVIDKAIPDFVGNFPNPFSVGGSEVAVRLQVNIGPGFYNDVSDGFHVHFASTTCACDVLDATVPEPAPLALALAALALTATRARLSLRGGGGSRGRERD